MTDNERERVLAILAKIYAGLFGFIILSVFFLTKEQGKLLMVYIFPISSLVYATTYIFICKGLKDETKRLIAFSPYGNGRIEGISYSVAIAVSIISMLFMLLLFYENNT